MNISIAMATYNGERFIGEQLASLADQSVLPSELVVCDDGSHDRTLEIVAEFSCSAPFPVHIHSSRGQLGASSNFMRAADLCTGDWIAFCDQDDIWLPRKLERVMAAHARDPGIVLVAHPAESVDENLRPLGNRVPLGLPSRSLVGALRHRPWWMAHGFCCAFASSMLRHIPWRMHEKLPTIGHDTWVCMIANVLGTTATLQEPLAWYRRHGTVVTESQDRRWRKARFLKLARTSDAGRYEALRTATIKFAEILEERASCECRSDELVGTLREGAAHYRRVAEWYHRRVIVHGGGYGERSLAFLQLLGHGAYCDNKGGFGVASMAKDGLACLPRRPR